MRHLLSLTAVGLSLVLSGCQTMPQHGNVDNRPVTVAPSSNRVDPLARTTTYTCEESSTIVLTEGQPDAKLTLNSGLEVYLKRTGVFGRYGASPYEFTVSGTNGTLVTSGKPWRCRVK
jgi:hypothetical protein